MSGNKTSSLRNQSNSFTTQYSSSNILPRQYCIQLSHNNIGPNLQNFSDSAPKSRIMPICPYSAELIRESKNLLPSVTSQESQRIGRLPLRYKWDELPITLQQDILKALYQYKN